MKSPFSRAPIWKVWVGLPGGTGKLAGASPQLTPDSLTHFQTWLPPVPPATTRSVTRTNPPALS